MYYLISLFLGGRCFPPLFLYRPGPLCILPEYLGFLAPSLFVFLYCSVYLSKKEEWRDWAEYVECWGNRR